MTGTMRWRMERVEWYWCVEHASAHENGPVDGSCTLVGPYLTERDALDFEAQP